MRPHQVHALVRCSSEEVALHLLRESLALGKTQREVEVKHFHHVDGHGVGEVASAARGKRGRERFHGALGACARFSEATLVELARERRLGDLAHLAELVRHVERRVARDVVGNVDVDVGNVPEAAKRLEGEVVGVAGNRATREHAGLAQHARGCHAHEDAMVGAVRLRNPAPLCRGDEAALGLRAACEGGHRLRRHGAGFQRMEDLVGGEDARDHGVVEVCERPYHRVHEELVAMVARGEEVPVGCQVDLAAHGLEAEKKPVAHEVRARREVLLGNASVPADEALACGGVSHASPPRRR